MSFVVSSSIVRAGVPLGSGCGARANARKRVWLSGRSSMSARARRASSDCAEPRLATAANCRIREVRHIQRRAGGVVDRMNGKARVRAKEYSALRECDRMAEYVAHFVERRARRAEQAMMHGDDRLGDRVDPFGRINHVVRRLHGADDRIFDRQHTAIDFTARERAGDIGKLTAGHRFNIAAPELLDRLLAEGAQLALEGDAERGIHEPG